MDQEFFTAEPNDIEWDWVHLEDLWLGGLHRTHAGQLMRIHHMTDLHLRNTIRYFSRPGNFRDTTPLKKELKNRIDAR